MKANQKKKKKSVDKAKKNEIDTSSVAKTDVDAIAKEKKKSQKVSVKKAADKRTKKKNQGPNFIDVSIQFLKDSKAELKKVKWPTRKELLASTIMVVILTLIVAFYLGIIDFGLIKIIKHIVG